MKNIDYSIIVKMDSPSLSGIIEFWDEYDTLTLVLAYTELEKRRFPISQRLKGVESKICLYNAVSSIDKLLESYKEQINAITSESSDKNAESTRQKPRVVEDANKYIIKGYFLQTILVAVIAVVINIFLAWQESLESYRFRPDVPEDGIALAVGLVVCTCIICIVWIELKKPKKKAPHS